LPGESNWQFAVGKEKLFANCCLPTANQNNEETEKLKKG
jgi:hypothetical protein